MTSLSRIPASRALVCDILHFDKSLPTFSHDRIFFTGDLATARAASTTRISWPALFLKAYAVTASKYPRLSQTWMSYPVPHLYQHPHHVGTLAVRREFEGDEWLFWARIHDPAGLTLKEIQGQIDRFQTEPVEQIFRRQVWLARQIGPVRRFFWWLTQNLSGRKKCKRLGTYFLSTVSGRGAEIQHLPSLLTTGFTYGPIDEDQRSRVTITYDHRLLDGHHVADILRQLEADLNGSILAELQGYAVRRAA